MPYARRTPFGTSYGNVTDEERMNFAGGQNAAALAIQERLAQMQNQTAMRGQDMQRDIAGTFGQRSAHEGGMFDRQAGLAMGLEDKRGATQRDLARINLGPQQTYADIARGEFDEGRGLREAERGLKTGQLAMQRAVQERMMGMLGGAGAGAAGASGAGAASGTGAPAQFSDGDLEMLQVLGGIIGGKGVPDITGQRFQREAMQMEMAERKRRSAQERAQSALQSGDPNAARQIAADAGVSLPLPNIEDYLAQNPSLASGLQSRVKDFYERDISDFSQDPSEGNIQQIQSDRDALVALLVRRGYPQEQAVAIANKYVSDQLGGEAGDWEAEWTQRLRQRLGF